MGHLNHKIVPEMTYNVLSGTLNPTVSFYTSGDSSSVVYLSGCLACRVAGSIPGGGQHQTPL